MNYDKVVMSMYRSYCCLGSIMQKQKSNLQSINSLEDALERCKSLGMRVSKQRRYILELLWEVQEHLSAKDIYDLLTKRGKIIGHTSVYQNLDALAQDGIVECLERSQGRLYGNISAPHSHVHCLDTKQIIDIQIELPQEMLERIEALTSMRITNYTIDFYGHHDPYKK
jgi:Fur family transcriptional regulator, ferric uptake regulator